MERIHKQETSISLAMILAINGQAADQRCRYQRIARQSLRHVLRQITEPYSRAGEGIKPPNGTIRHDHDERRRQMAPRILRDLPLEILVEGLLAADEAAA